MAEQPDSERVAGGALGLFFGTLLLVALVWFLTVACPVFTVRPMKWFD